MTDRTARAIAVTIHEGQQTSAGGPVFDHVQRVAAAVAEWARVTAWLHEVLERTDLTIDQLHARGMSAVELSALALLTRAEDDDYRGYVQRIADAAGRPGDLARAVKLADLDDHLAALSCVSSSTPPYAWARRILLARLPPAPVCSRQCRPIPSAT